MKTAAWFIALWAAPLVASIVAIGIGAGVTGKSVAAGETAVLVLIPLQLGLFLAGTGLLWKLAAAARSRGVLVAVHAVAGLGTVVVLTFATLLAFNR